MKILVDKLPKKAYECLFYKEGKCSFCHMGLSHEKGCDDSLCVHDKTDIIKRRTPTYEGHIECPYLALQVKDNYDNIGCC